MFDRLLSTREESRTEELGGTSNNVLLFGSVGFIVIGVLLMGLAALRYANASAASMSQQVTSKETVSPAVRVELASAPAPSETASKPSTVSSRSAGEVNTPPLPIASNQLSVKDQQIYDDALKLINQFTGNGNQLELAYNMLTDLAKRNPNSGYPYAAIADLKYRLADLGENSYADAYALAQRAIKLDPKIADAYVVVAKVLIQQQQIKHAREAASKAIALAPGKPEAMFAMARTSEEWAKLMVNESAASQAAFGEPDQLWDESERWYRKAIDSYEDNVRKSNIYYWLGDMLHNKIPANDVGAIEALTKSAEFGFDEAPWTLNNIGVFLMENTDRYDQAIDYFEQALKLMGFGAARTNLGLAEFYKWGDSKRNPNKYRSARRKPLSPDAIAAKTGVTAEYAFIMNAGAKAEPFASIALVQNGTIKDVNVVPPDVNASALIGAARANHLELARLLIAKKANVNYVDKNKRFQQTAIFYAVRQNNVDMVKLLVENGARLNLTDAYGTPLAYYALSRYQATGKPSPILLSYLLQHGADPTAPAGNGFSLLETAVSWNDVDAVRLLANKYHAEVNLYVPGKRSSLLEGANSKDVAAILLKAGANPWVKGMDNVDVVAKMMSPSNAPNPNWPAIKQSAALILEARKHVSKPKDFGQDYQGEWGNPE